MSAFQEIDEFLKGMADCKSGEPHKQGMGEDYDRGYRCQYEAEQVKAERTSNGLRAS